jgi:hypothetical protein
MSDRIIFHTSAPIAYDGFSTRTAQVVGRDTRNGEPVRRVSCEPRDYGWQTARYLSGCCRYTSERVPIGMYTRFGDWVLDTPPASHIGTCSECGHQVEVEAPIIRCPACEQDALAYF